jgi:NAD(P)-dependent dehydrogenase (short-subunit alcohol dehydrogenase family)
MMEQNVLNTDLRGKVAVITGAGGLLCSAFAKVLARAGAKVALLDLNEEAARTFADEINREGGTARAYGCNVLDKDACETAAAAVLRDLGPCDILLNGAGGNSPKATTDREYFLPEDLDDDCKTFFDLDKDGVSFVFDLNFLGTLLPTQAFARQMADRAGCNILNISSMNAYTPLTKIPAYSAAKAAVGNFTQWLAVHFSRVGIRVNAIAPGFFATKQNAALLYNDDGTPTARTGKILAATPMGRFGNTETELAGAVLFLLNNDAAGFITGVTLPIDGGFSAYAGV